MKRLFLLLPGVVACSALLGLPDPSVDPNFGLEAGADGFVPLDGSALDAGTDGPIADAGPDTNVLPDGGCDCFGGPCTEAGACLGFAWFTQMNLDPRLLDHDGQNLYFVSGQDVRKLDIVNKVPTVLKTEIAFINDLRAAGGNVFIATGDRATRCSSNNCQGTVLNYVTGVDVGGIAPEGAEVFFTARGGQQGIFKSPLNSAAPSLFQSETQPFRVDADGTHVAWTAGVSDNGVVRCGRASCASKGSSMQIDVQDFVMDATNVYIVDKKFLWRQPRSMTNGGANQIATIMGACGVRVDSTYAYVADGTSLKRCSLSSCMTSVEILASGLQSACSLALTADSVFVASQATNTIWRVKR